MPDISMCSTKDCPKMKICYRHEAKPNPHRQSYFAGDPRKTPLHDKRMITGGTLRLPVQDEEFYCSYFWKI